MGREYKNVVPLDGFPRVGNDGKISYPMVGYEFVKPARGPLYKSMRGKSDRVSCVRKQGSKKLVNLHPRQSTSSDLFYWSIATKNLEGGYNDHVSYARICLWALNKSVCGKKVREISEDHFSRNIVVHHTKTVRMKWHGKNINIADDSSAARMEGMLRDAHSSHHGAHGSA